MNEASGPSPGVGARLLLLGLAVAGSGAVIWTTRGSPPVFPDSVVYISAARNLLHGLGFSMSTATVDGFAVFTGKEHAPITHFPPLYPALLATLGLFAGDPLRLARWLGAALFGLNIGLVAATVYRASRRLAPSVVAAALMLGSIDMLNLHGLAASEPLFLTLSLATLLGVDSYCERPRFWALALAAFWSALACLTRYHGVALVGAACVGIATLSRARAARRLAEAAAFGSMSVLPLAAWVLRNRILCGTATNRELELHGFQWESLQPGPLTVARWLAPGLPGDAPVVFVGFLLLLVFVGYAAFARLAWSQRFETRVSVVNELWIIYVAVYLATLCVSLLLFDAATGLAARILAPIFVATVVLATGSLSPALERVWARHAAARVALAAHLVFFSINYAHRGVAWVSASTRPDLPYGFNPGAFTVLATLLESLPPDALVFSNRPDIVYLVSGRPTSCTPALMNKTSLKPNPLYLEQLAALRAACRGRPAVFVAFKPSMWQYFLGPVEDIQRSLNLRLLTSTPYWRFYRVEETRA